MPNPSDYPNTEKGYKRYMNDCMHTTLHKEHKEKEHGLAQCLNMWRQKRGPRHPGKPKKKMAHDIVQRIQRINHD
jgi:hypothetical protein